MLPARRSASIETVHRRRFARRHRKQRPPQVTEALRSARDAAYVAERLQSVRPGELQPIHHDRRYWDCRGCGWDVLARQWADWEVYGESRHIHAGDVHRRKLIRKSAAPVRPESSEVWKWWAALHPESRGAIVALSAAAASQDAAAGISETPETPEGPESILRGSVGFGVNPVQDALAWGRHS